MNRIKVQEFIKKHKIKPALAAGFKSHLRAENETELEESVLIEEYEKFSGVKLSNDVGTGRDQSLHDTVEPVTDNTNQPNGVGVEYIQPNNDIQPVEKNANYKKEKK